MNRQFVISGVQVALAALTIALPVRAQGDECSHGSAVLGVSALLHAYAQGDSTAFEETLGSLLLDPAYLTRCSDYDETDEVVIEAAVHYFRRAGRTDEAARVIDVFELHLGDEALTRWRSVRESLIEGGEWTMPQPPWDGTFSTEPFRANSRYARLACGGSGKEYGLVRSGEGWSSLGLRSITTLAGYAWPYEAAIRHGSRFTSFAQAAQVMCGGQGGSQPR